MHSWFNCVDFVYHIRIYHVFCFFNSIKSCTRAASFTFPSHWGPCILYMYPCYGFQWSNISHLLSLLKIYAFEEFWYVFWIFQMQDILWIFDIRIWMIFIFNAITEICDLLSSADCTDSEKWATFPLYNITVVFFCISPTQCKVYYIITITAELSAWKQNADFIWKPIALNL